MKKNIKIIFLLFLLIFSYLIIIRFTKPKTFFVANNDSFYLQINTANSEQLIFPWYDEADNLYYFFLPSYVNNLPIIVDSDIAGKLSVNHTLIDNKLLNFDNFADTIYALENNCQTYNIKFICSQNIPSLFISSNGADFSTIYDDKENYVTGLLTAIDSQGKINYKGNLERISGRGNTTWFGIPKKPYSIKLEESSSLFGLSPSSKWALLANWRDPSKLQNKLALDMGQLLDLEYSPQSTWIDLYMDGSYLGNYLLCTPVSVNKYNVKIYDLEEENYALNPNIQSSQSFFTPTQKGVITASSETISGGYLIEKELPLYYEAEPSGFITNENNHFVIKSPEYASPEQVSYIADYVQNIENLIVSHDQAVQNYLDFNSYSKKNIIDEITHNPDFGVTSCYFYKQANNDLLYSGPIWDYDSAFGIHQVEYLDGKCIDYTTSFFDKDLTWNKYLYENSDYLQTLYSNFATFLPQLELLITKQIDSYSNRIAQSVAMDRIRWKNYNSEEFFFFEGHYSTYNANVEYLKYFLTQRTNHLIEIWDIDYTPLVFSATENFHKVSFMIDNTIVDEYFVKHGNSMLQLPELDSSAYTNWYFLPKFERYSQYLPILEDTTLIAN
ncbi:MAG: CotH kinase family protein [Lachnospiraceae bacterium]|nr:CotH kinase family protein [Lachnospiraceae bacterium]